MATIYWFLSDSCRTNFQLHKLEREKRGKEPLNVVHFFWPFLWSMFFIWEESGVSNRELLYIMKQWDLKILLGNHCFSRMKCCCNRRKIIHQLFIQSGKIMPHNIKGFHLWTNRERAIPIILASQGIFIHLKCSKTRVWDLI